METSSSRTARNSRVRNQTRTRIRSVKQNDFVIFGNHRERLVESAGKFTNVNGSGHLLTSSPKHHTAIKRHCISAEGILDPYSFIPLIPGNRFSMSRGAVSGEREA